MTLSVSSLCFGSSLAVLWVGNGWEALSRLEGAGLATLALWLTCGVPLRAVSKSVEGTELRGAVGWAALAWVLGLAALVLLVLGPILGSGFLVGPLVYLTSLTVLAALVSVLNARTPGGTAWAILMALLVVVFLIPWLEGAGIAGVTRGRLRLRLDSPWNVFFGLVVVAGVTNYGPTRFWPSALVLALTFGWATALLSLEGLRAGPGERLWAGVLLGFAVAGWLVWVKARRGVLGSSRVETLWFWFRDHWGVVWGLRVMERFNQTAESQAWPFRLSWHGLLALGEGEAVATHLATGEETLRLLIRRFARPSRCDRAVETGR